VRLGLPPRAPHFGALDILQGPRFALGMLLNQQAQSVLFGMYLFLALFLLRVVVRKVWLAGALLVIVDMGLTLAVSTTSPALDGAEILIVSASMLFLLVRFGLLSAIGAIFYSEALDLFPLTADFSAWYAGTSAFALLVVGALAVYAFHTALAGKPAFRLELLGD
jgi:hypothetical protein